MTIKGVAAHVDAITNAVQPVTPLVPQHATIHLSCCPCKLSHMVMLSTSRSLHTPGPQGPHTLAIPSHVNHLVVSCSTPQVMIDGPTSLHLNSCMQTATWMWETHMQQSDNECGPQHICAIWRLSARRSVRHGLPFDLQPSANLPKNVQLICNTL